MLSVFRQRLARAAERAGVCVSSDELRAAVGAMISMVFAVDPLAVRQRGFICCELGAYRSAEQWRRVLDGADHRANALRHV